jgi:hypothetical protein
MATYTNEEKQSVKHLFQSLVVMDQIGIREIVDGLAIPDYNARAKKLLACQMTMLPNCPVVDYRDSVGTQFTPEADAKMRELMFDDLCELMTDQDIDSCLKHHINYDMFVRNYEREQAEERSGWQSMISLDERSRVKDMTADDTRKTWSLFV